MKHPIRIVFMSGHDLFSRGVQWWTMEPANHVAYALGPNGSTLLHATTRGVVCEPRWEWYKRSKYSDAAEYDVIPDITEGVRKLFSLVGQPYNSSELYSQVLLKAARVVAPWLPRAITAPNSWTCARLVMQADPNGDLVPEWREIDHASATPGDLSDSCEIGMSFRRVA